MKIGAVIVTWNSARHIDACLESCRAHVLARGGRVVVIDNGSQDETVRLAGQVRGVEVLPQNANLGFAGAVNLGFGTLADCEAILVLNPDARIVKGLDAMTTELSRTGAGAVGGMLVGEDGQPQVGFCVRRLPSASVLALEALGVNRLWPRNPVNWRYRCLDLDLTKPAEVEQPAGAFVMIRQDAWQAVGGFDEDFHPLWFEDVDFMNRNRAAGFRVSYVPDAVAIHAGGHSLASISWGTKQLYWYGSLLKYAARHYTLPGRWMVSCAVILGAVPRAVTGTFQRRTIQPLGVYGQVVRLAVGHLWKGRRLLGRGTFGDRCAGRVESRT